MTYDPRLAADGPYGSPNRRDGPSVGKGSVRAARERIQAQRQMSDNSRIVGLPQRPNQLVSQFSAQNMVPPQQARTSNSPSPTPPWPLPASTEDVIDSGSGQYSGSPDRIPPRRPARPTLEELSVHRQSQDDMGHSYQSDERFSPTEGTAPSRPLTTSSIASNASSLGSIPDFPVPQPPMPVVQALPRRNASLGPPPSARRGPSSYYTQMSYVSPIAEEAESRSEAIHSHHGSFASSMAIPAHVNDYYLEDDENEFESDDDATAVRERQDNGESGRVSRGSDHDDRSNLVRQASLGRRTKPALTTIKSSGSLKRENKEPQNVKRKPIVDHTKAIGKVVGGGGAVVVPRDQSMRQSSAESNLTFSSGTALFDPSSSSSDSLDKFRFEEGSSDVDASRNLDPEKSDLTTSTHPLQTPTRQTSLAERVGDRRPPKLNVDAVRDAEARGSLTSLPDLIRRATRLAANLDRGRTASRLGLDFWESGGSDKAARKRSGSLSDMLAAFPPPGEATPNGDRTPNKEISVWPAGAGFPSAGTETTDNRSRRRRKCCGMPMWTFVTLLIVLLFLVTAAVVIPIVLIVIPKMKDTPSNTASTTANDPNNNKPPASLPPASSKPGQCDNLIKCQNGGVAVPNSARSCNCVCINGFTGKTCATNSGVGCTTIDIDGTANNATVGSGVPRLLRDAQINFSIPLDPPRLLSLFSGFSLSCAQENALVTFNGLAARSEEQLHIPLLEEARLEPLSLIDHLKGHDADRTPHQLARRQAVGGAPAEPSPSLTTILPTASTSTPTPTPTSTLPIASNTTALDFARVVVLFVLQETSDADIAAGAQGSIQDFLNSHTSKDDPETSVKLENGFEIDLAALSLDLGNGTTLQAPTQNATLATG